MHVWRNRCEEGGHQAIISGALAALLLFAAWAIERLVPFEGWWQAPMVPAGIADRPRTMRLRNGRADCSED